MPSQYIDKATIDIEAGKNDNDNAKASPAWHAMTKEEVLSELRLNSGIQKDGLTTSEAQTRLAKYGFNQLSEKKKVTLLEKIWNQVNNVLVAILLVVAVVSAFRAFTDEPVTNSIQVGIIVGVIAVNTTIGIIQEGSAEKAAEALRAMLSSDAVVVRNGIDVKVPANEVVPGDMVVLSLGDRIPADLRMLVVNNLSCAEAALTGEVVPIEKSVDRIGAVDGNPSSVPLGDRNNMAFSATLVSQGSGVGVVVATGDSTEIGTINALVNKVEKKKTAVLEQIDTVSKFLAVFIIIVGIVTFLVARFTMDDVDAIEAISIALVCAVAMIPEGLGAIVTCTYAWAVKNMAKSNAIIRALPAVETLGSVTVICSDKTGTLTKNEMSLAAFVTSNGRYKVDVNSADRANSNFVRDDTFMAERADHMKMIHATAVIKEGPSTSRSGSRHRSSESKKKAFEYNMTASAIDDMEFDESNVADLDIDSARTDQPVGAGQSPEIGFLRAALAGGVLCSKCTLGKNGSRDGEIGNPTELSILRASYWAGIEVNQMKEKSPMIAEVPFNSEYKFMATVHESCVDNDGIGIEDNLVVHVKGAPDRMLRLCSNQAKAGVIGETEPIDKAYWKEQIAILSSHGLRVLALLRGAIPSGSVKHGDQLGPEFVQRDEPWLSMVGLCAIMDPPRPECVDAVAEAHRAGVRVAMITGDHKDTALAIGCMLGLVDEERQSAITGTEMDAMDDDEFMDAVQKYNVFARASPQNKIRIVKALQAQGEVCGMTGDGVNDAPALKAADMGVAMGKEGTDVAREASEMILADDNFASIIGAVREGRVVWDNLRKVLLVNTPINNAQGLSVLFGLVCGLDDIPLTAIQVLYCNLICAVTLGFVTAVEPAESGIMKNPPRRVGKRLIGRFLALRIILGTTALVATTVGATFWGRDLGYDLDQIRSQASNTLTFGAIAVTLSARFAYNSSFHPRLFSGNPFCWIAVAIVAVLQVCITYIPGLNDVIFSMGAMDAAQWAIVLFFMCVTFFVMEIEKAVRRYLMNLGEDTDDREYGYFDAPPTTLERNGDDDGEGGKVKALLPKGASHLNLTQLRD